MNRDAKLGFIEALLTTVGNEIKRKVESMPEEWDGVELRQYIADRFADQVMWPRPLGTLRNKARRTDYRNAVITRNL